MSCDLVFLKEVELTKFDLGYYVNTYNLNNKVRKFVSCEMSNPDGRMFVNIHEGRNFYIPVDDRNKVFVLHPDVLNDDGYIILYIPTIVIRDFSSFDFDGHIESALDRFKNSIS